MATPVDFGCYFVLLFAAASLSFTAASVLRWHPVLETPTRLLARVAAGHDNGVQQLVLLHPDWVSATDSDGNTLLHLAAVTGQETLVRFLLAHGASPNIANHQGYTPLVFGVWARHHQIAIVDALVAAGADPQKVTAIDNQDELISED